MRHDSEYLGTTWQAEPVCDAPRGIVPLDLHVVSFEGNYYGTIKGISIVSLLSSVVIKLCFSGRKKLEKVENELQAQCMIRHPCLLCLYAVKLTLGQPARIALLMEQRPGMSLRDLLRSGTTLRPQKATVSSEAQLPSIA